MPMQEGEELAIMVGFNGEDDPMIRGYVKPRGKEFTPTEIKEAYISASA